jgi:hypothetical protein
MSISPIGNSDPYARYRQQQIDLLAPPTRASAQTTSADSASTVAPAASSDPTSSSTFTAKFKADLTALISQGGTSGPRGAHGHHHHGGGAAPASSNTDITDPNSTTDPTSDTSSTNPFSAALDQFAEAVKQATDTVSA